MKVLLSLVILAVLFFPPFRASAQYVPEVRQALAAFSAGDIEKAGLHFDAAIASLKPPMRHHDDIVYRVFKGLRAMGPIRPEYRQRVFVLVSRHTRVEADPALSRSVTNALEIQPTQHEGICRDLGILARFVEYFSRGRLTLDFEIHYVDTAVTRLHPSANTMFITPDYSSLKPFPHDVLRQGLPGADVIFTYVNLPYRTYDFGGSTCFPLLPYSLNSRPRGFAQFNTRAPPGLRLLFHEYFHSVEKLFGLHTQDDFIKGQYQRIPEFFPQYPRNFDPFAGLADNRETWNYYAWQLGQNIPAILEAARIKGDTRGWKRFAWSESYPQTLIPSASGNHARAIAGLPTARLRQAEELRREADALWKKNDKAGCDSVMTRILGLNPGYIDGYRYFAERQAEAGRHAEALKNYDTYLSFVSSWWHAHQAGRVAATGLKDAVRADRYCAMAIDMAAAADKSRARFEWAWTMGELLQDWPRVMNITDGLPVIAADRYNGESQYLRVFAAFRLGNNTEMTRSFAAAARSGILDNSGYARHSARAVWDLVNSGKHAAAEPFATLAMRFKDPRWGNETRFFHGEVLWLRGDKSGGEREMRAAMAVLNKSWFTKRFRNLTEKKG